MILRIIIRRVLVFLLMVYMVCCVGVWCEDTGLINILGKWFVIITFFTAGWLIYMIDWQGKGKAFEGGE